MDGLVNWITWKREHNEMDGGRSTRNEIHNVYTTLHNKGWLERFERREGPCSRPS